MKRYFEFIGEDKKRGTASSAKFWELEVIDSEIRLRYGPIGKKGQITLKSYDSEEDAQAAAVKLIREKTNKGYEERESDKDADTCPSCGTETLEGASFCIECGEPLHDDEDEDEEKPTPWLNGSQKIYAETCELWAKAVEANLEEDLELEVVIGAHYAKLAMDGLAVLNLSGNTKVKDAHRLLAELVGEQ